MEGRKEARKGGRKERKKEGRKDGRKASSYLISAARFGRFHKVRPPGHGVVARTIHSKLPRAVKQKIGKRTVQRRLADKGYVPDKKSSKTDHGTQWMAKRLAFAKEHEDKSASRWKSYLHACFDLKEFTYRRVQASVAVGIGLDLARRSASDEGGGRLGNES